MLIFLLYRTDYSDCEFTKIDENFNAGYCTHYSIFDLNVTKAEIDIIADLSITVIL